MKQKFSSNNLEENTGMRYNSKKRSDSTQNVIDRLNRGDAVSIDEIMELPEVIEAETAGNEDLIPTINRGDRSAIQEEAYRKALEIGSWNGVAFRGNVRKGHRADIVIGLPGSGKSSVYSEPLSRQHNARLIDTDEYRAFIPEYNGKNAAVVHEEASMIRNHVYKFAVFNRENIILSTVGQNAEKLKKQIAALKKAGYEVYLHLNELPNSKAVARVLGRYVAEDGTLGRYVPIRLVASYGNLPTKSYLELTRQEEVSNGKQIENDVRASHGSNPKSRQSDNGVSGQNDARNGTEATEPLLAGWDWYSNDVPFGEAPRLIESYDISVEIGSDGNAVYNIGDMEERSFPTITGSSADGGAQKSEKTSFGKRIPQSAGEVKQNFSFDDDVKELDGEYLEAVEQGDIQRGRIETASARKIMRDQTDAVQRAAQNPKGIKNKKAPPKQSDSLEKGTAEAEHIFAIATEEQKKPDEIVSDIARKLGLQYENGNQKSLQSIINKVRRKGYSAWEMKDHCRTKVELKSWDQIPEFIAELEKKENPICRRSRWADAMGVSGAAHHVEKQKWDIK